MNLTGYWSGWCRYHSDPTQNAVINPVPFSLELIHGWFGRLRGCLIDELIPGSQDRSPIHGRLQKSTIHFTMVRSVYRLITPQGSISLADYIKRHSGKSVDQPVSANPVHYAGTVGEDEVSMSGTWHILHAPILFLSQGIWYEWDDGPAVTTGTWELSRGDPYSDSFL